jgi:hypothetical protein
MNRSRERRERNIAVCAAYAKGVVGSELAAMFDINESYVYRILARGGVQMRPRGQAAGTPRRPRVKRAYNKATRVDLLGERESLPPGVVRYSCPICGMRAEAIAGHSQCQEVAA